jgi:FkbM family methyltransferase
MAEKETRDKPTTAFPSATMLKDCRYGKMLFLRGDKYVGRSLDLYSEYSELEGQLFSRLLSPGHVVIEVGANIGAHTVHLARLVGPKGMVLAYEPQRVIFQMLCVNVALNKLLNVRTCLAAVGRCAGSLKVPALDYTAENNFGGVSLRNVASGEPVPVTPLDSLRLPSLRLVKIDVEGMEGEVLSGARRLIARHRPLLYVENDRRKNSQRLMDLSERLGYEMWWHLPPLFNPNNYAKKRKNLFGSIVSMNLLCAPKEAPELVKGLRKVKGAADFSKKCE